MADKDQQPDTTPAEMTRWTPAVWVRFLLIILCVLAADLGLKAWSFENVADTAIRVHIDDAGGPEVLVPEADTGAWLPANQPTATRNALTHPDHPETIPFHEPTVVVPSLLNFQLTLNTGAVFGTGQGGRPIFIAVSLIAIIVITVLIYRSHRSAWVYHLALAMILGGAIGNLYDRVRFAAVRDMLHMFPDTKLWPWIFNPADVALVLGVSVVLVVSFVNERKLAKQNRAEQKPASKKPAKA